MKEHSPATDMVVTCADRLATAESQRRPTEPLTRQFPELTLIDAYLIQQTNVSRRTRQGERVVGHKVGLTAKAMQDLFGVREPGYGPLLDTMIHEANQP